MKTKQEIFDDMKRTDIFDRLNNTIGNHMKGNATDRDLIKMAYEVDKYLLEHPHPHDLIRNNVGLSNDVGQSEQLTCPRCKSTNILSPDKDNDAQCIECAFIWAG